MRRKTKQVLAQVAIGVFLVAAVGAYAWTARVFDGEENASETETTSHLVQPKPVDREELLGKTLYDLGENVEINELVWNISGAEIVDSYESLDAYYKRKDGIMNPESISWLGNNEFIEETKYLVLKYAVTNNSTDDKMIYPGKLDFYNRFEDDVFKYGLGSYSIDGRCLSMKTQSYHEFSVADVVIAAGTTLEFEYVLQYNECGYGIYDLYVSLSTASNMQGENLWGVDSKVCLNIAPKYLSASDEENALDDCYAELRDIPALKSRQWTNLDMVQYQEAGYPMASDKEGVDAYTTEDIVEQEYELGRYTTSKITDSKVISWNEMPQEYITQGSLELMAQQYEEKYGLARGELKLLLMDVTYTHRGDGSENAMDYCSLFDIYMNSFVFTRDSEGKRWVFGSADDWIVKNNTVDSGRTGHINIERMRVGDSLAVQMAYILPPEIYNNHSALYFCGGELRQGNYDGAPVAEIPLK